MLVFQLGLWFLDFLMDVVEKKMFIQLEIDKTYTAFINLLVMFQMPEDVTVHVI